MRNYPDIPDVKATGNSVLDSLFNYFIRKTRRATVTASGAAKLINSGQAAITYGAAVYVSANDSVALAATGGPGLYDVGVSTTRTSVAQTQHVDIKCIADADAQFVSGLADPAPAAGQPFYLSSTAGKYTNVQGLLQCASGVILNTTEYTANGGYRCRVLFTGAPVCPSQN